MFDHQTRWAVFAGILCLACTDQAQSAQPSEPPAKESKDQALEGDILLGAARNAVQRGDVNTAIQRFHDLLERFPDREDGRRGYADALFLAGRVQEAMPEYERLLERHPNDPQLVRLLVDALLNIGDHPRAKNMLADAMVRFPDRVEFALSLALLHALDGETIEAESLIQRLIAGKPLLTRRAKLDAASLYTQLRRPADAEPIVADLMQTEPDSAQALALSVRYAILIGDHAQAIRQADKLDRLYPGNIDLRLELASSLYAAGSYFEAGDIFLKALNKSPDNPIALLGCARVALRNDRVDLADAFLERTPADVRGRPRQLATVERDTIAGNYLRARETLTRLLDENPNDMRASMALADLYRTENEFVKADAGYAAAGVAADRAMVDQHHGLSLYLQCRYAEAESVCQSVLAVNPADSTTRVLLARILAKFGRCEEAADQMRQAQEAANDFFPEGLYFLQFVSPNSGICKVDKSRSIHQAVALYDLAMEDGRRTWAKKTLDAALENQPDNVVLRTRLAEWHASFGLPAEASHAAAIYEELLSKEPSNHKWLLGLARANVTMRCYDRALAIYRRLRCESPDNYLYARETARVVFFVCGTPKGLAEYDAAFCGWPGLEEEACRLAKERFAKSKHFCSPSRAATAYCELLELEPYEQHLAFELGQVRGMLGTTTDAIAAYDHLLDVNPNHRDAQVAIEGKRNERCQELLYDHRFVRERGRDGLTSIDRLGEYLAYQLPREEENEHLSIGYGRLSLAPTFGNGTTGDSLVVKFQKQLCADCCPWLSPYVPLAVFADCEVQKYDRYVSTRPVFEAGVKIHAWNDSVWTISGTMENVLENGESLQQDIFDGGLRADVICKPHNYWEMEWTYELQEYSDDNTRHAGELRNRIQLTPDPRRFTLLADCCYWTFAEPSVFSPGPDPFAGMLHPYWTPQDYVLGGVGIEWREWLSWDRFDGAQHCWVAFSVMKRWDNQDANYMVYRGTMNWDITRCLSGYAMAEYNEGTPYRGTWAYGGLAWKF